MIVDCDSCVMRERACGDCVVTLLLGPMTGSVEDHRGTLTVLADAGLVPPLRLVSSHPDVVADAADGNAREQVS